jgi:hypothetical protein
MRRCEHNCQRDDLSKLEPVCRSPRQDRRDVLLSNQHSIAMNHDLLAFAPGPIPVQRSEARQLCEQLAQALSRSEAQRYRFVIEAEGPLALPDPAGLAIGACLDEAIHQAVCPRPGSNCMGCPESSTCSYPVFGRHKHSSRQDSPWVIRVERPIPQLDMRGRSRRASSTRGYPERGANPSVATQSTTPADGLFLEPGELLFVDLLLYGKTARRAQALTRAMLSLGRVGIPSPRGGRRSSFRVHSLHAMHGAKQLTTLCSRDPGGQLGSLHLPAQSSHVLEPCDCSRAELDRILSRRNELSVELRTPLELRASRPDSEPEILSFAELIALIQERWMRLDRGSAREFCDPHVVLSRQLMQAARAVPMHERLIERLRGSETLQIRGRFRFGAGAHAFMPLLRFAERVGFGENAALGRGQLRVL